MDVNGQVGFIYSSLLNFYNIYILSQLPSVISAWHVIGTQWMMMMVSELSCLPFRFKEMFVQPVFRVTINPAFPETFHLLSLRKMACPFILKIFLVWMINYMGILAITRDLKNVSFFNTHLVQRSAAVFPHLMIWRYHLHNFCQFLTIYIIYLALEKLFLI